MAARSPSLLRSGLLVAAVAFLWGLSTRAGDPPARYNVSLRYSLNQPAAIRPERYFRFLDELKAAGLERRVPAEEEAKVEEATSADHHYVDGSILAKRARDLLHVREVQRILLTPPGFTLPRDETPVPVEIELEQRETDPSAQRHLVQQVLPLLQRDGFREDLAYDHRGHTRLVGRIRADRVESLRDDLRKTAKGVDPESLPPRWPIRVVTVRPTPAGVAAPRERAPRNTPPWPQIKISPELREVLAKPGAENQRGRIEVLLADPMLTTDAGVIRALKKAADVPAIEYRLDTGVVFVAPLKQVNAIAELPFVQNVRLPRPASPQVRNGPTTAEANKQALAAWCVDKMHAQGARGQGVVVAVVANDFRGYRRFLGKGLPADTRMVDLTAERNPLVEPEPEVGPADEVGAGTNEALAVALAAPQAQLVLVRVAADGPFQLNQAARYFAGDKRLSPAMEQRRIELLKDEDDLQIRRQAVQAEREQILRMPLGETDPAERKRRDAYFADQAKVERDGLALSQRRKRFLKLVYDCDDLRRVRIVGCGLVWNDGWPMANNSELTRGLDDQGRCAPLWLQAAGDTAGQAWGGLFRDADGSGVMEFAAPEHPLNPGRWSSEINFFGWRKPDGKDVGDVPAKARVRLTVQWREVHDRLLRGLVDESYAQPLVDLGFLVLRQRDPSGKKLPADAMEWIEESPPIGQRAPYRLTTTGNSAVYEHALEFEVPSAGVYAVQVEGLARNTTRHADADTLPALRKYWELRPRIFVQVVDSESRKSGRPVWIDQVGAEGAFGMPADSRMAVVVGALGDNKPRSWSPVGAPGGMPLLKRPDVSVPDGLDVGGTKGTGTAVSTGFAAGVAACAFSAGSGAEALRERLSGAGLKGWTQP